MITEHEITAALARQMRQDRKLSQKEFWGAVGVHQSVGCKYEQDVTIPRSVRTLLVAHYVAGVKIDAGTPEGVAELARLGSIQSKQTQAKALAGTVRTDLNKAIKNLETARDALQSL